MALRKYFCRFPRELIQEPIVTQTLGQRFGVKPNILAGSEITETSAIIVLSIDGTEEQIQQSVAYLRSRGVQADEIGATSQH